MIHLLLAIIYLSFISLGLPDAMLGSAWPSMYPELNVPVSYAGIISMIIAVGTVVSSLLSDRITKYLGAGCVTAGSVGMTAIALLGFSFSNSFWVLCALAVPYGLGAGSVDAALNNYVALHYSSKHMSWLHCMWGLGAVIGPAIMGYALTNQKGWDSGFLYVSFIQIVLSAIIFASLPLWKRKASGNNDIQTSDKNVRSLSLTQTLRIPGAKEIMFAFFCYSAVEQTGMLWASSYMVLHNGVSEDTAAKCASAFFIGITAGRLINGFLTIKFTDTQMIRVGEGILTVGIIVLFLPFGQMTTVPALLLIGLGCAPIYPCIIHSTPERFGVDRSQAMIGVQMASAYIGTCAMPPIFGLIARHIDVAYLPLYLLVFDLIMIFVYERLVRKTAKVL